LRDTRKKAAEGGQQYDRTEKEGGQGREIATREEGEKMVCIVLK
jgi:hypothetical protein